MSDEAIRRAIEIANQRLSEGDGSTVENRPSKWEQTKQVLWDSNLNTPLRSFYNMMNSPTLVTNPTEEDAGNSFNAVGAAQVGSAPIPKPEDALLAGIKAYHVSPHLFDRFKWNDEVAGTGEGNAAYGEGLYFAESPKVSGPGGNYWQQFHNQIEDPSVHLAGQYLNKLGFDREAAIRHMDAALGIAKDDPTMVLPSSPRLQMYGDEALKLLKSNVKIPPHGYEVELGTSPENLVNLDKKMFAQSDTVKKFAKWLGYDVPEADAPTPDQFREELMANLIDRAKGGDPEAKHFIKNYMLEFMDDPSRFSHKDFYRDAMRKYGMQHDPFETRMWGQDTGHDFRSWLEHNYEPEEFHADAAKKGVHGSIYRDGLSRKGTEDPTHNFVIWNDKIIDIKNRFADGGTVEDPTDALKKAEGLSSYEPSWTDVVAQKLLGDSKPSTWWSNTVQNLTGSTGLGSTGYLSAKDFVPAAGQVLNAQQAYHEDKPWSEVALNLVPGISTAGREAILAEQAAAKAAPKAVDGVVDLARRSLFAPRAKPEPIPETDYSVSNPGGAWIENKQKIAQDQINAGGKGVTGADTANVGLTNNVTLPVDMLRKLPGANDEVRVPGDVKYDRLHKSVTEAGQFRHDSPVVVAVNHNGEAYLKDGNTRTAVAKDLGIERIPAQVYWMNGAEDAPGPWNPKNVLPHVKPVEGEATPITASAAAEPSASFLDKPVSRRAVNEGLAGAGAAAVLGPTFGEDLLRSSIPRAADNVVTPVVKSVVRATPEQIAGSLKSIFHKPMDTSILERHIGKDSWSDFADPFNYDVSLADEGHNVEMGHVFDDSMMHDPRVGSSYQDPESYTSKKLAAIREDYKTKFRNDLEESLGHPVTDEEFAAALEQAKNAHKMTTDIRLNSQALDDPDWGEHPVQEYAYKVLRENIKNSSTSRYPGYKKLMAALEESLTPENVLKHTYNYPDEEISKVLDTMDKNGVSMHDHLQGIIDDAKESGIISEDYFDPDSIKEYWKEWAPKTPTKPVSKPSIKTPKKTSSLSPEEALAQKTALQSQIDELTPRLKQLSDAKYEAASKGPEASKAAHDEWWTAQQECVKLQKQLNKIK